MTHTNSKQFTSPGLLKNFGNT